MIPYTIHITDCGEVTLYADGTLHDQVLPAVGDTIETEDPTCVLRVIHRRWNGSMTRVQLTCERLRKA